MPTRTSKVRSVATWRPLALYRLWNTWRT